MANICIISSGSGIDAENIINYFKGTDVNINFFVTDKFCGANNIGYIHSIDHTVFVDWKSLITVIKKYNPDLVVLAGFLKLVPQEFLNEFKTINIHPSLLPKFGGKGMWGLNVHKAVIESGEKESGITIHWVDKYYDSGDIIAQFKCPVYEDDNATLLQSRIKQLEWDNFPKVIEEVLLRF